jgi:alpha-beta hydrolase superfamily lysophospholipase
MPRETEFRFGDRPDLFARLWEPETNVCRGVFGIVHGLGEHCGRYAHLAEVLTRAGYAVLAFDLPGHGRSPGRRGHADYEILLDDVERLAGEVRARAADGPAVLYGHSLGGAIVLACAIRRSLPLTALIASSPLLRLSSAPPRWKRAAGRIFRYVCPWVLFDTRLDPVALSHDPNAVRNHQQDPLVHHLVSAQLGESMLRAGEWLLTHADRLRVPTLVMHGGADTLTSSAASRQFAERAGSRCTLKVWDGFRHELQWEPEKDQVFAYMLDWLDAIRAAEPSGPIIQT